MSAPAPASSAPSVSRSPWHPVATAGIVLGLVVAYVTVIGISAVLISDPVAAMVVANIVVIIVYVVACAVRRQNGVPAAPGLLEGAQGVSVSSLRLWGQLGAVTLGLWLSGQLMALWVYTAVGSAGFDTGSQARQSSLGWTLVLVLLAAPMAEEALVRGGVYRRLRMSLPVVPAAIVSAGVFALLHMNLVQIVLTLPLGVFLAFVVERTGRIREAVVLHVGFNLLSTIVPPGVISPAVHLATAVAAVPVAVICVMVGRRVLTAR